MKSLGVSPVQPIFERVADQAVLNCELTFETEAETRTLKSWTSIATYPDATTKQANGTAAEFWNNIVAMSVAAPKHHDVTQQVVQNRQLPSQTRILFYFAHTDYPATSALPVQITVSLLFQDANSPAQALLPFWISPQMYHGVAGYNFPVGWWVSDRLPSGREWFISQGHELTTGHRRYFEWTPFDGFGAPPHNSQKYAHDMVVLDSQGNTRDLTQPDTPQSYHAWGRKIYAVATGVVTYVERDVADLAIGETWDSTKDPGGGNSVIHSSGSGEFFAYAHLQHGSIPPEVQKDKKVYKGQVIGRIGHSGNSSEPHLHFQVQDGGAFARGDGLPSTYANISLQRPGQQDFSTWSTSIPNNAAIRVTPGAPMPRAIAAASWDSDRLDIFGIGAHAGMWHKAWTGSAWHPGGHEWQSLGGVFTSPPAVAAWGPNRLDIFGLGVHAGMWHKAWTGSEWHPAGETWQALGGVFTSPPAGVSWGPNRLDVFGLGLDRGLYHKSSGGTAWDPPGDQWEPLGGIFAGPPAVVSWGPNRLDVFGVGAHAGIWHKAWTGTAWDPPADDWHALGGVFTSPPAVAAWSQNRLDIFAVGIDGSMQHRAWAGSAWSPQWESLGGVFSSPPAVASWGADRLDIFALGTHAGMWHKAWMGDTWYPPGDEWQPLGGAFTSPPTDIAP